jgi:hypothetical protein
VGTIAFISNRHPPSSAGRAAGRGAVLDWPDHFALKGQEMNRQSWLFQEHRVSAGAALVILSALAVLTAMVTMLLSVPVHADYQHYHTTCSWSNIRGDKPLTPTDLYYSGLSCDTSN